MVTAEVLEDIAGWTPRLYRPPYGEVTLGALWAAWKHRHAVALWNRDPADYRSTTPREVVARLERPALRPGDVVLLHDVTPHAGEVTQRMLEQLAKRGLTSALLPGARGVVLR